MMYTITFHQLVLKKDLRKISQSDKKRIQKVLQEKIQKDPYTYGKPLRHSLQNMRSCRVGSYRITYKIEEEKITIFIVSITQRGKVYGVTEKRIS